MRAKFDPGERPIGIGLLRHHDGRAEWMAVDPLGVAIIAAFVVAVFGLGFALKRWWTVPLPFVLALVAAPFLVQPCDSSYATDCDTASLGAVLTVLFGAALCVVALIGVIAGRLRDRFRATSLPRRSS
jgi:hypothetical protein